MSSRWQLRFFYAAFTSCIFLLLYNAWVGDDAYFTFRTVYNAIHGYGLRWNIDDRVQAYTNPLWMLLHIPFYALFQNIGLVTIALSFLCAIGSLFVVIITFRFSPLVFATCLLLPFCLSWSMINFSSSGLENPLTSLLFACFGYVIRRKEFPRWFLLTLIISLSMLNRLDTVLAYTPVMGWLLLLHRRSLPWRALVAGALPIISWLTFSLFYYGFLFPNTKYAKLTSSVPASIYVSLGFNYIAEFIFADPVAAFIIIVVSIGVITHRLKRFISTPSDYDNGCLLMLCAGMLLYMIYIVAVGGSYLSCLFMTLPVFMALWLWLAQLPASCNPMQLLKISLLLCIVYAISALPAWQRVRQNIAQKTNIAVYNRNTNHLLMRNADTVHTGAVFNLFHESFQPCLPGMTPTISVNNGGQAAFIQGPCNHIINIYGLSDALLARLPITFHPNKTLRIGHLNRSISPGYEHALETGLLDQMPPSLANYYSMLHLIISGNLYDNERLKTILWFNLGMYDHWKEEQYGIN